jgi:hypothetical protein
MHHAPQQIKIKTCHLQIIPKIKNRVVKCKLRDSSDNLTRPNSKTRATQGNSTRTTPIIDKTIKVTEDNKTTEEIKIVKEEVRAKAQTSTTNNMGKEATNSLVVNSEVGSIKTIRIGIRTILAS